MKVRLRDNSGIRIYRYVFEDVDRHGKIRIYFRRKGRSKIVLKETPGTAAFEAEYQRAFRGVSQPPSPTRTSAQPATMRWLCEQYYASAKYQSLAPSTRKVRRGPRLGVGDGDDPCREPIQQHEHAVQEQGTEAGAGGGAR